MEDLRVARDRPRRAAAGPVRAGRALCRRARPAARRGPGLSLLLHPRRHRRLADRAARRCGERLSRHLPRAARRSGAARFDPAQLAARQRRRAGPGRASGVDRAGRHALHRRPRRHRRRDPRAQGCPRFLPPRLRRRRCRERRDAGRARRGSCAPRPPSSACSRRCSACPSRPISTTRSCSTTTAAASPSATSPRRSPRCATTGSMAVALAADLAARAACP